MCLLYARVHTLLFFEYLLYIVKYNYIIYLIFLLVLCSITKFVMKSVVWFSDLVRTVMIFCAM